MMLSYQHHLNYHKKFQSNNTATLNFKGHKMIAYLLHIPFRSPLKDHTYGTINTKNNPMFEQH